MNQVWPLRIGRFVYGLLLVMGGFGLWMVNSPFVVIAILGVLGAVIGIYLDSVARKHGSVYQGVFVGALIGFGIGLVVIVWRNLPPSVLLLFPVIGALNGGLVGTSSQTAKKFGAQLGLVGVFAGVFSGILNWIELSVKSGITGTTFVTGLAQLLLYLIGCGLGAGFIGLMVGAAAGWQGVRPHRRE